ncbi:OmpA family protein [Fulvivirga sp. M361]|uniref:OmpA family protein n=1 Tax=Fulvivirga sp. M361 TaxID=2594266 RepID=UPI00117B706D|nr:OmpA family protein [Fulvivirga sp. M361]TRX52401.1 OmpA family protein [Fulvivirga sp. M361]
MLRLKIILICIVYSLSLKAQDFKKDIKKADQLKKNGQYDKAITFYKRALKHKKGNADATYGLGLAYLFSIEKEKALPHLKSVRQLNPKIDRDIDYHLGLAYQYHYEFREAIKAFERNKLRNKKNAGEAQLKIEECILGDSLYNHPIAARVTNLGERINSRWHDYTPLITSDGKKLYFTSNRAGSTGGKRLRDGSYYEDIYSCDWDGSQWSTPVNISTKVNTRYHDAAASISPDGKTLFVYSEKGSGDIYISNYLNGDWTIPSPLSDQINSVFWETSVSITADGKTLYFASERPGGLGGLDIYRSELQENGEWGKARNLGPEINTSKNEDSPVIHPDGQTLYFSSSGHPGIGGFDIFYSKLDGKRFQKPVNIGYPINTVHDDNYFVISADRTRAYYASQKSGGVGMADIYYIDLTYQPDIVKEPEEVEIAEPIIEPVAINETIETEVEEPKQMEEPVEIEKPVESKNKDQYFDKSILELRDKKEVVTVIKGTVLDASTATPLEAQIRLVNNVTNTLAAEIYSDPITGSFELIIPHGGNYGVSTKRRDYLFNSINFKVPAFSEYQEIDLSIFMDKAKVGSKVILKNVFFDSGSSDLRTESLAELEVMKVLLTDAPNLKVQINGHTDNVGAAVYNKVLSKKRAQSVIDYLVSHGIDASRLQAKGFGEERPLVSNDDETDGREINRRTEIEITAIGDSEIVP